MIFVIGPPMMMSLETLTNWLMGMQTGSALLLGRILGAMMALNVGGAINNPAYAFAVGLSASYMNAPMAAGVTPRLGRR